jgi:hypothetical protein
VCPFYQKTSTTFWHRNYLRCAWHNYRTTVSLVRKMDSSSGCHYNSVKMHCVTEIKDTVISHCFGAAFSHFRHNGTDMNWRSAFSRHAPLSPQTVFWSPEFRWIIWREGGREGGIEYKYEKRETLALILLLSAKAVLSFGDLQREKFCD